MTDTVSNLKVFIISAGVLFGLLYYCHTAIAQQPGSSAAAEEATHPQPYYEVPTSYKNQKNRAGEIVPEQFGFRRLTFKARTIHIVDVDDAGLEGIRGTNRYHTQVRDQYYTRACKETFDSEFADEWVLAQGRSRLIPLQPGNEDFFGYSYAKHLWGFHTNLHDISGSMTEDDDTTVVVGQENGKRVVEFNCVANAHKRGEFKGNIWYTLQDINRGLSKACLAVRDITGRFVFRLDVYPDGNLRIKNPGARYVKPGGSVVIDRDGKVKYLGKNRRSPEDEQYLDYVGESVTILESRNFLGWKSTTYERQDAYRFLPFKYSEGAQTKTGFIQGPLDNDGEADNAMDISIDDDRVVVIPFGVRFSGTEGPFATGEGELRFEVDEAGYMIDESLEMRMEGHNSLRWWISVSILDRPYGTDKCSR